ncbi:GMC family oxidoreductase N-terminal domain-containing protein [Glycomyces sp. A-F 0318]|uniref:GMC family oxidoreductase N-terminal domain-containing protein n=1 Tax=Glycomyces amatae TaxID=2881355 RepID=UPI001E302C3F|nr:GMC family oxidoreductase N-terminal domain-containing protein [Glycomyces amatae]MCD0445412.1 GMC family oxidoreductase N-terminal domain-containing protein [Glycomyces amatae]
MSGEAFRCLNGGIEYELRCDGCGGAFHCHDDSFYSWDLLCAAAEAEGWRVEPDFEGEHECGACMARATFKHHRHRFAASRAA